MLLTHEPGDTEIGQKLRRIVLDPATGSMSDRTETLLYAADKAEHVERVVLPALRRGAVVVTDRYVDSTLAYQGAGRDLADEEVERIARWATGDLRPHLTVLLDLEPRAGLTRFEERDRIEGESLEFHERVRSMFLRLAAGRPGALPGGRRPEAGRGDRGGWSGAGRAAARRGEQDRCGHGSCRPSRRVGRDRVGLPGRAAPAWSRRSSRRRPATG